MEIIHQNHNDRDPDQDFEIQDYRQTLAKSLADEQKIYGRKNKPRQQDPSMYALLSWKDEPEEIWDYTVRDKERIEINPINKIKYKIKKSESKWVTESMDQFRKFVYSPDKKKAVFIDLHEPEKTARSKSPKKTSQLPQHPSPKDIQRAIKKQQIYMTETNPKFTSDHIDNYGIKDLKTMDDVLRELNQRQFDKDGNVIQKTAQQIAEEQAKIRKNQPPPPEEDETDEDEVDEEELRRQQEEEEYQRLKTDFSKVHSRIMEKKIPKAKVLDPVYEKDRINRRKERIRVLNETTRWLPNSAFYTYFGKPPFENYGRGNVQPTVGGTVYGQYMKTHNVNPHRGGSSPQYKQVYDRADMFATKYGPAQPEPPRKCKEEFRLSEQQVQILKKRSPLEAEKFDDKLKEIVKPDLMNSLRFASEENTPRGSVDTKEKKKVNLADTLKSLSHTTKTLRAHSAKKKEDADKSMSRSKVDFKSNKPSEKFVDATTRLDNAQTLKLAQTPQKDQEKASRFIQEKMGLDSKYQADRGASDVLAKGSPGPNQMNKTAERPIKSVLKGESAKKGVEGRAINKDQDVQVNGKLNLVAKQPQAAASAKQLKTSDPIKSGEYAKRKPESPGIRTLEDVNNAIPEATIQVRKPSDAAATKQGGQATTQELIWNQINGDMEGGLEVNAWNPPKNYLFTLSEKETNPKFYKNVPAVWLNRIPYAGTKNIKNDDIKNVFSHE
jgi:hypothetical protein